MVALLFCKVHVKDMFNMWERIMQTMIMLRAGCEACEEAIVEKCRSCSSCLV